MVSEINTVIPYRVDKDTLLYKVNIYILIQGLFHVFTVIIPRLLHEHEDLYDLFEFAMISVMSLTFIVFVDETDDLRNVSCALNSISRFVLQYLEKTTIDI